MGALYIAMGAGKKIGTGTGRTVFDPPPVSTVSLSSSEHHSRIYTFPSYLYCNALQYLPVQLQKHIMGQVFTCPIATAQHGTD